MCYRPSVNKRIENTEEQRKVSLIYGSFHDPCWSR